MNFKLSKLEYFADFGLIPLFAGILAYLFPVSLVGIAVGIMGWTLIEYVLHRFFFHDYLHDYHDEHHTKPAEYIGVSPIYTAFIVAVLNLIGYSIFGSFGVSLGIGIMLGYLYYISVHWAYHHTTITPKSWLYKLKMRHIKHHHGSDTNYGVSTSFWDRVFGTLSRDK
jgi:sterol desaturase/sphingolipid hydroxylase (fatty acid hydroxylase superfamily)